MENIIDWAKGLNCAITVSDTQGQIVYMNDKSAKTFEKSGGKDLIGTNLNDCHNPKSIEIINRLLEKSETNVYTIEKAGVKKLIYQTPWYTDGKVAGLVELSVEIPFDLPHFLRG
jgi:transcriptional regulator with PAS, ATPase and Fis domain